MVEEVIPKSFEDLIKDVHEPGICGECGGCVSFCSAHDIKAIEMPDEGPPRYYNKENCLKCGICYLVCPQTHVLDEELNKKFNYKTSIGNWVKITSAQANSKEIREKATDGGVVTAVLIYLLEKNLINGAIVSKKEGPFNRFPFFATTKEDLIEAAGSHYDISHGVVSLEKYNSFVPTITELKSVVSSDAMNIAVVGTPCQIMSIRKMQELSILPAHIIKYTLGLFCNLNFSFDLKARKKLEEKFNFSFNDVENLNIKENLIIELKNNQIKYIDFKDIHEFARAACFACRDFSNVYADISFGGLGSKDGYTTAVIRTKIGEKLYNNALKEGYIKETPEFNTSVKKSEMLAKVISFGKRKYDRYLKAFKNRSQ
ncbi:MAG: Coenzyme F420 hydrogenase/dehydrogenase, beta subunit C-terminal domain [Candidatus Heimdallarchaeota archaeon]